MSTLFLWLALIAALEHVQSFSVPAVSSMKTKQWKFQGHDVFCQVSVPPKHQQRSGGKKKPAVILIHGFGCSTLYWRETVASLTTAGFEVHAIDLFGQGMSAKPGLSDGIEYSTGLWAKQVDAYARENLATGPNANNDAIVLIGNSLGSLVALAAATGEFGDDDDDDESPRMTGTANYDDCYIRQRVAGIGMFNCGIGLNIRNIVKDPKWNAAQRYLLNITFDFLEYAIFGNLPLMTWFLDKVVTRDLLRNTLTGLYKCAANPADKIDDDLIDSFYLPAKQTGSAEVLCQILTNDAGLTPMEIHAKHAAFLKDLPIHLVWGNKDTVVPLHWQVGQFYSDLAAADNHKEGNNPTVSLDVINGGHIPFDEVPDIANGSMLKWLDEVVIKLEQENKAGTSLFGRIKLPF